MYSIMARKELISAPWQATLPNQHLAIEGRLQKSRLRLPTGAPRIASKRGSVRRSTRARVIAHCQYPFESPRAPQPQPSAHPFQCALPPRVVPIEARADQIRAGQHSRLLEDSAGSPPIRDTQLTFD